MKFLSALLSVILLLASLVFALSNRQEVTADLWPFGLEISAPLYIFVLLPLAVGLLCGGFFIWLHYLPHRFRTRRLGKDVVALTDRLQELEQELAEHRAKLAKDEPPLLAGSKWRFWDRFK